MKNLFPHSVQPKTKLRLSGLLLMLALLALLVSSANTPKAVAQDGNPQPVPTVEATPIPSPSPTIPPCGNTP